MPSRWLRLEAVAIEQHAVVARVLGPRCRDAELDEVLCPDALVEVLEGFESIRGALTSEERAGLGEARAAQELDVDGAAVVEVRVLRPPDPEDIAEVRDMEELDAQEADDGAVLAVDALRRLGVEQAPNLRDGLRPGRQAEAHQALVLGHEGSLAQGEAARHRRGTGTGTWKSLRAGGGKKYPSHLGGGPGAW